MTDLRELMTKAQDNPTDWGARLQLAQAYTEAGRLDEALTALRGDPQSPMTLEQSRIVKELRSKLDPEGITDLKGPLHPVSGEAMSGVVKVDTEELIEPHGERSIILAGDVDPEAIKPHEKNNNASQKVSAVTAAVVVHAMLALLLVMVVIAPPHRPITGYGWTLERVDPEEPDIIIETPTNHRVVRDAPSSSSLISFTQALGTLAPSVIAISDFDETNNLDVSLGINFQNARGLGGYVNKNENMSEVEFFSIRSSGSRMVFIIEASRYMLTDRKGGIPAYNKVKNEISRMLAGLNGKTAFNLILFDGKKIATYRDKLVAATPSNVRQAIEWLEPINKNFEKIGLREGYVSQPLRSGVEPIPVHDLTHYIKATQRALEMDVDTVFLLSNGWGWHGKSMEPREYRRWMHKLSWGEKEEEDWAQHVKEARDWLMRENEARQEKGIPRRVVTSLNEIVSEIRPAVRHKPGPSYTMEEVQDQLKNAVSIYYRAKSKPRPRFNIVWFVGEDEEPSPVVEAHLEYQTRRNRGKLKVLKGVSGLKNVTGD